MQFCNKNVSILDIYKLFIISRRYVFENIMSVKGNNMSKSINFGRVIFLFSNNEKVIYHIMWFSSHISFV